MPEAGSGTDRLVPRSEPGLGPYRGPVVVLALMVALVAGGIVLALVGVVRSPDGVSNSATVLGTFPIDPGAEGIPAGPPEVQGAGPSGSPASVPSGQGGPGTTTTTAADVLPSSDGPGPAPAEVIDAFDGELAAWEPVGGDWATLDGDLVVPAAGDDAPAFLLRTDASPGVGAVVGQPARASGLVVGYSDPSTYVAALQVPSLGGWRIEVVVGGDVVDSSSVPAPTRSGTTAQLVHRDGVVALAVDGAEVGTVAAPDGLGDRAGFVARGPVGASWADAVAAG